jgi:hypothetical protein
MGWIVSSVRVFMLFLWFIFGSLFCVYSTNGDERNAVVLVVAGDAICLGIKHRFAIHDEQVAVVAVMKVQTGHPPTIGHASHGSGGDVPFIEVADELHTLGRWSVAEEVHVMARLYCGVTSRRQRWAEIGDRSVQADVPFQAEALPSERPFCVGSTTAVLGKLLTCDSAAGFAQPWRPAEEEALGAHGVRQDLRQDRSAGAAVANFGAPSALGWQE